MTLGLTKLPDEEPEQQTTNPLVGMGPIVREDLPDTDTVCESCEPIGVRATCELFLDTGSEGRPFVIIQRITSPGIWGVECDDPDTDAYVAEVFKEERDTLLGMLRVMGIEPLPAAEVTS